MPVSNRELKLPRGQGARRPLRAQAGEDDRLPELPEERAEILREQLRLL
jgi:hypothetical protein